MDKAAFRMALGVGLHHEQTIRLPCNETRLLVPISAPDARLSLRSLSDVRLSEAPTNARQPRRHSAFWRSGQIVRTASKQTTANNAHIPHLSRLRCGPTAATGSWNYKGDRGAVPLVRLGR